MSLPVVVGLLGRAGSGKSTAAKHIEELFDARRHSMAWPLKKLAEEILAFTPSQVFGTQAEKEAVDPRYGISAREFLIRLGEGARRWISPSVWVDGCMTAILASHVAHGPAIHVIEDIRHVNEAEMLKSDPRIRGYVIKLEYLHRESSDAYNEAPSELSVDQVPPELIDTVIRHDRTPDASDLKVRVGQAVAQLVGPISLQV